MSRRKLLLADDSITIQKVVNLTFADEGIEVIAVGDGNSALDRMQETPPDLVMADVNMPGLGGYELCERIKQNERLRHIPVILLVGSFEPFDEREAARVGADDFLTKPFQSIRQLVNKVTGMLETTENRRAESANAAPASAFAETAETGTEGTETSLPTEFTAVENSASYESGVDDEMIQTSYGAAFPLDEAQKFESRTLDEEDAGKTQPLSAHDLKDFAFVEKSAREFRTDETTYETEEEPSAAEDAPPQLAAVAPKPAPPVFDFDDLNFLEIPFDEDEEPVTEPDAQVSSSAVSETVENLSGESNSETRNVGSDEPEPGFVEEIKEAEEGKTIAESETVAEDAASSTTQNFSFPPELIEAIAQKVADKLSARTASDVAPQVADLIMQKMAEEKLKQ